METIMNSGILSSENLPQASKDLMELLIKLSESEISSEDAIHQIIQKPEMVNTFSLLAGKLVYKGSKIVSFGEQAQVGDITVRDIAGGNIYNINLNAANELEQSTRTVLEVEKELQKLRIVQQKHIRNLQILESVLSSYETEQPIHLLNSVAFEREALQRVQDRITSLERPSNSAENFLLTRHNLPRRPFFAGRQAELNTIAQSLHPSSRTFIVAIEGLGGVGKSALAIEAAYQQLERGEISTAIWVSAKDAILTTRGIETQEPGMRTLRDVFLNVDSVLGNSTIGNSPLSEQIQAAQNLLSKQTVLLIIDNAETLTLVEREQIIHFVRQSPVTVKAIITSRERIPEGHTIQLQGLQRPEAEELLAWNSVQRNLRISNEQTDEIIEVTGGVPLAMIWIQGQMSLLGQPADRILEQIKFDARLPILSYCFSSSWSILTRFGARDALIATALHVDAATREAIGFVSNITDHNDRDRAIAELLQLSLLLHEPETDRYNLLPLTRTFVRSQMRSEQSYIRKAEQRMSAFYLRLVKDSSGYQKWREYDLLLLDRNTVLRIIQVLHRDIQRLSVRTRGAISSNGVRLAKTLIDIVRSFGSVLWQRALWYDRLTITHASLTAAELIGDWDAMGTFCRNIAWIYFYQGDNLRAREWAQKSLAAVEKTGDRLLIAAAQRTLGTIEVRLHNYQSAEELLTNALNAYRDDETNDYELYNLGFSRLGLGELAFSRNDLTLAEHWYKLSLTTWEASGRKDPIRHVSYSLNGLGLTTLRQGKLDEAEKYFNSSSKAANDFGRAEELARSQYGLAEISYRKGDKVNAILLAKEAVSVFQKLGMSYETKSVKELITSINQE